MKYDLVTIGDSSEDVFIRPLELKVADSRSVISGKVMSFELGEKIPIESVDYSVGGSSCNLAVGLSRMGLKTSVFSIVGQDSPAEKIIQRLIDEGVDTDNIQTKEDIKTNFSVVINTKDGERTIFVYHGWGDYREIKFKKGIKTDWIFLSSGGDHLQELEDNLVALSGKGEVRIAWNPGAIQIEEGVSKHKDLLKNLDVLFLNREEAIKFTNFPVKPKDEDLLKKLHNFGPKIVVITKGRDGAKVFDGNIFYKTEAIEVKVKDSTGAGDGFAAGFLGKLAVDKYNGEFNKELISEALKYGIINSTSVLTEVGAQSGLLSVEGIEAGLAKHPRMSVEVYS
jgi:sugar/nucleoside kinase (ribokinase family)